MAIGEIFTRVNVDLLEKTTCIYQISKFIFEGVLGSHYGLDASPGHVFVKFDL